MAHKEYLIWVIVIDFKTQKMKKGLLLGYYAFISFVGFSQNIVSYTNLFDSHTLLYCYSPKTTNSHPKETIPI